MSTITLDQPMTNPVVQGSFPGSLPLPGSTLSLLINAPGVRYKLETPVIDNPVIEDNKITARFVVDDNVYLDLNLIDQSIDPANKFKSGQFSLFYKIEERRPRAHFVAYTLMAVMGLAGRLDLEISEPKVSTNLSFELPLLEISKMLHRRQTMYRLMVIEQAMDKEFLLPSTISEKEIETIAFIYHAIVDRSFIWDGGSLKSSIPATEENASSLAQLVQPFSESHVVALRQTVLGQSVALGRATLTIEDAVVKNLEKIREQLEARDGRQVTIEIVSLSGRDKYEFTEIPYSSGILWEPKIKALVNLEPYLDAAIAGRYHALAAATLEGLTEEEKAHVVIRPELDEDAFIVES